MSKTQKRNNFRKKEYSDYNEEYSSHFFKHRRKVVFESKHKKNLDNAFRAKNLDMMLKYEEV